MSSPSTAEDADCPFCGIAAGTVPADVVASSERAVAFRDLSPQAPVHVLVVPRAHHRDVGALAEQDGQALVEVLRLAAQVGREAADGDHRVVFNTGPDAGQSVFHVHAHVLAGRPMRWPPG